MKEGWHGNDHLILFNDPEILSATDRYAITQFLPGYKVIGLRGWDDFIVQDSGGATYCVPTVPAITQHLVPYALPPVDVRLVPENRFEGKIKWHIKPVVFGGDPNPGENVAWVSHEQHAQLVRYWNELYRSVKSQRA